RPSSDVKSAVIGSSLVETEMDRKPDWPRPPSREELESGEFDNWGMVKVTRVASILELLDDSLQAQVKQLYASLIFRSPCVGANQLFGFDGAMNRGRHIEEIEVGFSDLRIESITVRYNGGVVAGPYGASGNPTRSSRFSVAQDEGITDILVWEIDDQVSSIQLLESSGRASPVYGYRQKQLSHVGGHDGSIWSDLMFLGHQSKSRITSITARAPGTGILGGLQTTYASFADGLFTTQTTLIYGTDSGPTVTWKPNEDITSVRGRHNGKSICELQFVTDLGENSPAFGQPVGDVDFSINAPKTREGKDMVLYGMAGTSDGSVNSIVFVWEEVVGLPPPSFSLIIVPWSRPDCESDPRATFYDLCTKSPNPDDAIASFEEHSMAGIVTRSTG
ncbi:hypothetical protein FRC11_001296, partial [Ceratobasidium sp. 423]